jgi:hypothetical protein
MIRLPKKLYLAMGGAGLAVLCLGLGGGFWLAHRHQPVPQSAASSGFEAASFPAYKPSAASPWQSGTPAYDAASGVLTLSLKNADNTLVLTQQSSPQVFSDVPQQYARMLATMNQYAEVQTSFGTVALTRPKELNGGQAAVINKTGTLLFAKPTQDLNNEQWTEFFNNLQLAK